MKKIKISSLFLFYIAAFLFLGNVVLGFFEFWPWSYLDLEPSVGLAYSRLTNGAVFQGLTLSGVGINTSLNYQLLFIYVPLVIIIFGIVLYLLSPKRGGLFGSIILLTYSIGYFIEFYFLYHYVNRNIIQISITGEILTMMFDIPPENIMWHIGFGSILNISICVGMVIGSLMVRKEASSKNQMESSSRT